jgi:hypothetical protein
MNRNSSNRTEVLTFRLSQAEKRDVTALAEQARLPVSELCRRLVTGQKLPDTNRHLDVIELVRVNADLARLGNLLRMALTDEEFVPPEGMDLDSLFESIRKTQYTLKTKIKEL